MISYLPSLKCSTNFLALTLRNFQQGSKFGEFRRTANCSSVKPWFRFLLGIESRLDFRAL